MAEVRKPATQKEMVEQLWYAVIGSNGEGLAETVKKLDKRVDHIDQQMPTLQTKAGCILRHDQAESEAGEERRHQDEKRIAKVAVAFGVVASLPAWVTLVVMLVSGG